MKRVLALVFTVSICVLLLSCKAIDRNNLFEVTTAVPTNTVVATNGGQETTEPIQWDGTFAFEDYMALGDIYQHSNMQGSSGGKFLRLGNEVLFTYIVEGRPKLYRYDLASGEVRLYCDNAACTHSDCVAGAIAYGLEVYQGIIYGIEIGPEGTQAVAIDGTEIRPLINGKVWFFIHHDDNVYMKTADGDLAVLKEGYDMPQVILEEYTGSGSIVFNDYLIASTANSIIRINLADDAPTEEVLVTNATGITDGQHIYYADMKTYYLYRCDMDGSNAELLLQQPVLPASWNYDDEYFYYRLYTDHRLDKGEDCFKLYRFSKSDPAKIEQFATLPVPAYQVYTVPGADILFVNAYVQSNGSQWDIYVMGKDGSHATKLEIPEY